MLLPLEIKIKWEDDLVDSEFRKFENGKLFQEDELRYFYDPIEPFENNEIGAYITWYDNPCTNIMIHYIIKDDIPVTCLYRKLGEVNWQTVELYANKPFPNTPRKVKWFKLSNLQPDTVYETKLENSEKVRKFKTMPSTLKDVKVLVTSDQLNDIDLFKEEIKTGRNAILNYNPDVLIINGDVAHDDGVRTESWLALWDGIFDMMDSAEIMIPITVTLGNHDGRVNNPDGSFKALLWYSLGARPEHVPFVYNFFSNIDETGYSVIDIGDYCSLLFLNGGHTVPVDGTQKQWLENILASRQDRHVLPLSHAGCYPATYGFNHGNIKPIRDNWSPLFTQYGIKVALSGHEHVSLVTKKVTGDSLDSNGVVYVVGGGGMGANLREPNVLPTEWYVDYLKGMERQFDCVTLKEDGSSILLEKLNLGGSVVYSKII